MRGHIDAGHLRTRRADLLLRAISNHMHQRSVRRLGWLGIVLHERVYAWDNMSVELEPSDMRGRGERLYRVYDHDLRVRMQ